jgi:hypothetical protein
VGREEPDVGKSRGEEIGEEADSNEAGEKYQNI